MARTTKTPSRTTQPSDRRGRQIARHVRLAAAAERAIGHDWTRVLRRATSAAAERIERGDHAGAAPAAEAIVSAAQAQLASRLAQAAMDAAALTDDDLGAKADAERIEEKRAASDPYARAIREWAAKHAAKKVVEIGATIAKLIKRILTEGLAKGQSNAAIAKRIRTAGLPARNGMVSARAARIARTETHTATQTGSYEAAKAAKRQGVDLIGEWGATEDRRTRAAHAAADGQIVEIGKPFIVDGEKLRYPGDPKGSPGNIINCRCVALWRPRPRNITRNL